MATVQATAASISTGTARCDILSKWDDNISSASFGNLNIHGCIQPSRAITSHDYALKSVANSLASAVLAGPTQD